jgi:parallel beta-helix repeat protein
MVNNTSNNNKTGIYIKSSNNSKINNNTVNKNKSYGIYTVNCKKIIVNKNKASSNKTYDIRINSGSTGNGTGNSAKKKNIANKKSFSYK